MSRGPRHRAHVHRCEDCRRSVFEHDIRLTRTSATGEPWRGVCSDDHAFECAAIAQSNQQQEATA